MSLGLCMSIRNEEKNLPECLDSIIDVFDDIIIVDTGSKDSSVSLLRDRYGIQCHQCTLSWDRCNTLADCRNLGFSKLKTDWIFCLDADERISREELLKFKYLDHPKHVHGYFCRWTQNTNGRSVQDYKLSLFRNGASKVGLVHDNIQLDLRANNRTAVWIDSMTLVHCPDYNRASEKREFYRSRLEKAIKLEPDWLRYHWFLGYHLFKDGRQDLAMKPLTTAFLNRNKLFPVESLNSALILAWIHIQLGSWAEAKKVCDEALNYYNQVAEDFEVKINSQIPQWFRHASMLINQCSMEGLTIPEFMY